ncbi:MAG: Uroporphyrinogen-III C-methyltransferase [Syntrophorhabdus sp. PtaU1.Bin002]|nr:MAG: Uroporphyrinogen-III C-methyltransferase [Syntrophorhabdus sp. PtaU1.Bin002]
MGRVYLVGAGPGDLKLITLRGLELIQRADVIIYDFLVNPRLLDFCREGAEIIYVGKQASHHELPQPDINNLIIQKTRENEVVVRLKGGDPFIFGRGGEEAQVLAENGIPFEIIPGITSAIAVPAYAGIPLTHREYASTVAFITGHEDEKKVTSTIRWEELAAGPDTLVFLMGVKNLKTIKDRLIKGGRSPNTGACLIQWGTLPGQRVVAGTLGDIDVLARREGIKPPAIILIGNVVKLRNHLSWFENRPLFGKKIAITRAPHQSLKLGELLTERGADVLYMPTIVITPIEPNSKLERAIDSIETYPFILFTSTNAVSIFFDSLFRKGRDARALSGAKVLPIGPATATLLQSKGIIPDFLPGKFTSEGIIEILKTIDVKGEQFLLPRAEEARDIIVEYIKDHGGSCDVVPVYKASLPKEIVPISEKPDIVTFTSSSTVRNFIALYGKQTLEDTLIASIGPVTTGTLRDHGFQAHIEAERYDIPGLVKAIEQYVRGRSE